jgi:5-methylcytosine-specific restriction enzyme A
MAANFSKKFYQSKAWRETRASYIAKVYGLCERCLTMATMRPCEDVHHKIRLTPENINDPNITLNHDHLMALCKECHNSVHGGGEPIRDDVMFDSEGQLIQR